MLSGHAVASDASHKEESNLEGHWRKEHDRDRIFFEMPVKHLCRYLVRHRSLNIEVRSGLQIQGTRL